MREQVQRLPRVLSVDVELIKAILKAINRKARILTTSGINVVNPPLITYPEVYSGFSESLRKKIGRYLRWLNDKTVTYSLIDDGIYEVTISMSVKEGFYLVESNDTKIYLSEDDLRRNNWLKRRWRVRKQHNVKGLVMNVSFVNGSLRIESNVLPLIIYAKTLNLDSSISKFIEVIMSYLSGYINSDEFIEELRNLINEVLANVGEVLNKAMRGSDLRTKQPITVPTYIT